MMLKSALLAMVAQLIFANFLLLIALCTSLPTADRFPTREAFVAHLNSLPNMTWTAGINERFRNKPIGHARTLCGVQPHSKDELLKLVAQGIVDSGPPAAYANAANPPEEFDSIKQWPHCAETIGDIRDQSNCGCCWAFGAASAASDRMCIATQGKIKVPLSSQATCFCAKDEGCNGGTLYTPWSYIQKIGLVTGGQYQGSGPFGKGYCSDFSLPHCHHHGPQGKDPYPAEGKPGCPKVKTSPMCPTHTSPAGCDKGSNRTWETDTYTFKGTVYMYPNQAKQIQTAIMQHGPVEAAFAVYEDFENYVSGIYQHKSGEPLGGHAIRIVGWGTENTVKYWKVANSWNKYWGEDGYFRIIRSDGPDGCGIQEQVTASSPAAVWSKKK